MKKSLAVWWVFPGFVTGLSVLVTGDRFCLVCVGYWQQTFGLCWLLATDFWSVLVTGSRLLVCLGWLLATDFWAVWVGYWQQPFGLFVLVTSNRPKVSLCWLLATDFRSVCIVASDGLWLVCDGYR